MPSISSRDESAIFSVRVALLPGRALREDQLLQLALFLIRTFSTWDLAGRCSGPDPCDRHPDAFCAQHQTPPGKFRACLLHDPVESRVGSSMRP